MVAAMNLHQLRVFVAIAEAGSITRASRRLKVSQPAVSKQLTELELALGAALFDRIARGVRLTEAGRLLEVHARRIFAAELAAEAELAELAGVTRGRLSIGASTTIGSYLIPAVFGRFSREHPSVKLELEIGNTATIQAALLDNRLDLGLTEGFVASDALEVEAIASDDMVLIAAPSHPLCSEQPIAPRRLLHVPYISRERGSGSRDVIEAALAQMDIELDPIMSLGSTEAVKNAVAAGLGVAMVSRLTVDLELSTGRLCALEMPTLRIRRALHLLRLKTKRPSPAIEAFVSLLRETLAAPVAALSVIPVPVE
jgi:DNA-binding transcriptional LysR family regulator